MHKTSSPYSGGGGWRGETTPVLGRRGREQTQGSLAPSRPNCTSPTQGYKHRPLKWRHLTLQLLLLAVRCRVKACCWAWVSQLGSGGGTNPETLIGTHTGPRRRGGSAPPALHSTPPPPPPPPGFCYSEPRSLRFLPGVKRPLGDPHGAPRPGQVLRRKSGQRGLGRVGAGCPRGGARSEPWGLGAGGFNRIRLV